MRRMLLVLSVPLLLAVSSCSVVGSASSHADSSSVFSGSSYLAELHVNVYGTAELPSIGEEYEASFEGNGIRIEGSEVVGIKGGTDTIVTLNGASGTTSQVLVHCDNRDYVSTHSEAEESEGWFDDVSIDSVQGMDDGFINGIDISSAKQLYDNGARFYDRNGNEQSLFYLLKDYSVNWVRVRLWNDPADHWESGGEEKSFLYGGGNCDLAAATWMCSEAKKAGLKVLLDFHYSDFWADPTNQVIPKEWASYQTSDEIAGALRTFTKDSLNVLKAADALPDMVQIGNETNKGLMTKAPGPIQKTYTGNGPKYTEESTWLDSSLGGYYTKHGNNSNIIKYFKAGLDGVDDVDRNIKTMIHFVKGFSDPGTIVAFYEDISSLDFDIIGLSAYSYWHFSGMSTLKSGLKTISEAFPNKQIVLAETSYGYTYETDSWASNIFSSGGSAKPVSGYPVSIQGQAQMVRDTSETLASFSNGLGVFYWEGAWLPVKFSGWADVASKCTWANQGFFSYNGKALGSLLVYSKMLGE